MSATKRLLEQYEEAEALAERASIKGGSLKKCWVHVHEVYSAGTIDHSKTYAIATAMWRDGEFTGEREALLDAVKLTIEQAPDKCWQCEKLDAE